MQQTNSTTLLSTLMRRPDRMAWVVFACSLGLYLATMATFPVLGPSAHALDTHLKLLPMPEVVHPVWTLLIEGLSRVWPAKAILLIHGLHALIGAGLVVIMYRLHARYHLFRGVDRESGRTIRQIRGMTVALFLLASAPVWVTATRAYPWHLGLFMTLASGWFLSEYHVKGSSAMLYGSGLLYGMSLVEYAMAPWFFPVYVVGVILALYRRRAFSLRRFAAVAGLVLCGVALVAVLCVFGAYAYRGMAGVEALEPIDALRRLVGKQLRSMFRGLPRTGWLMVLMVGMAPWLLTAFLSARRGVDILSITSRLIHVLVIIISLLVLWNVPISPWRLLGESRPLVLPYLFVASAFGVTVAALYQVLRWPPAGFRSFRRLAAMVLIAAPLVTVAAAVRVYPEVDPRPYRSFCRVAEVMEEESRDLDFVITSGHLDSLVRLAALARNREVLLMALPGQRNEAYRAYLAAQFQSPRLRGLAEVGVVPAIREILATEPERGERIGMEVGSELLLSHQLYNVPRNSLYVGVRELPALDLALQGTDRTILWRTLEEALSRTAERRPDLAAIVALIKQRLSRLANDYGVYQEDRAGLEMAAAAYRTATALSPQNLCAWLNLHSMPERDSAESDEAWEAIVGMLGETPPNLVAVSRVFGHIKRESSLTALRDYFVLQQDDADLAGATVDPAVSEAFDTIQKDLAAGRADEAVTRLRELTAAHPTLQGAWLLRGLVAAQRGDVEEWTVCWDQMESLDAVWPGFLLIQGDRAIAAGRVDEARGHFQRILSLVPRSREALEKLMILEFFNGDTERAENYCAVLLNLDPTHANANFVLGTMQASREDYAAAEAALRVALGDENKPLIMNNLAWVLIERDRFEEALELTERALNQVDALMPLWDTRGVALMGLGRYDDADQSFERALALIPDHQEVRIHVARLRLKQDRLEEARTAFEELAAMADELSDDSRAELDELRKDLGL